MKCSICKQDTIQNMFLTRHAGDECTSIRWCSTCGTYYETAEGDRVFKLIHVPEYAKKIGPAE